MRIESAELRILGMELVSPFETSFGRETERHCLIVRLRAEGLEGWGECAASGRPGYSYETTGTAWHMMADFFLPSVLGQELEEPGDLAPLLGAFRGHPLARAGLEMALWDLAGKRQGKPLAELLGGGRSSVPVGVSVGIQPSVEDLLKTVEGYRRKGYRRVKLKIKPGKDVVEVAAVRNAHPDLALQVDANSAYRLDDLPIFRAMESLDLLLIEQPLAEDDLVDHGKLQAQLGTPICLDESIGTVRHARQALEIGACRIINIKPGRVGGLSEAVAIHDLCLTGGTPVWCGGMLETGLGRAANLALASLPGFTLPGDISATARYYARDIALPEFVLNPDSTIDVPRGPGLGVDVVAAAVEQFTIRKESFRP